MLGFSSKVLKLWLELHYNIDIRFKRRKFLKFLFMLQYDSIRIPSTISSRPCGIPQVFRFKTLLCVFKYLQPPTDIVGSWCIFTMHTTHIMFDCNNRITLNKPSYTLCFLLWRHYFYWENTHHVESSHRITNLSPRNVDYSIIKLLRLICTKTGMCSVALKNEVDLSICRHSFVDILYKVQENTKKKLSSTA